MSWGKGEICLFSSSWKDLQGNCWSQVILGKRRGQLSTTGNLRLVESEYSWNKAIEIAVWEEGTVALMDSFHES